MVAFDNGLFLYNARQATHDVRHAKVWNTERGAENAYRRVQADIPPEYKDEYTGKVMTFEAAIEADAVRRTSDEIESEWG